MRTLIVAQGLERARIIAAVSIHAPNKVLVIRNNNDVNETLTEDVENHMNLLKNELLTSKDGFKPYPFVFEVDISTHYTDFFDLTTALVDIDKIIKKELAAENEVCADLSTGSKTISMALFLATQLNKVRSTYCKASKYINLNKPQSMYDVEGASLTEIVTSAKEPVHIPNFPIHLADLPYNILSELSKLNSVNSISDLLRHLKEPIDKSHILSLSRKLDIMEEYGYITMKREGKSKKIMITQLGKQISKLTPNN